MRITIIGATGSMSGPISPASSYLIEADGPDNNGDERSWGILLDMGPGSFGQLWRYRPPETLDAIALSHLHIDHCGDLLSMQIFRRWHPHLDLPAMPLLAPEGTVERMRGLDGFTDTDTFEGEFRHVAFESVASTRIGPMTVEAVPVWHTVPSFALRISGPGEDGNPVTVTYSGDTDLCDGLIEAARGADFFLCECGFTAADQARGVHLDGARAAEAATRAGVGRLVHTHIQPWTDPDVVTREAASWTGPFDIAQPGHTYTV